MPAAFGGLTGYAQALRHFFDGQLLEVTQQQRLAVQGRQ